MLALRRAPRLLGRRNERCVSALHLDTLNKQRAMLLVQSFMADRAEDMRPEWVSTKVGGVRKLAGVRSEAGWCAFASWLVRVRKLPGVLAFCFLRYPGVCLFCACIESEVHCLAFCCDVAPTRRVASRASFVCCPCIYLLLQGAGVETVETVVEVQAAGGATCELGPRSELVVAAQGGLRRREVSPSANPLF